jgi:hypothetical protein
LDILQIGDMRISIVANSAKFSSLEYAPLRLKFSRQPLCFGELVGSHLRGHGLADRLRFGAGTIHKRAPPL